MKIILDLAVCSLDDIYQFLYDAANQYNLKKKPEMI